ncbi:MAG: hypothetical protein NC084_00380 [Bacteroides sp.]|nr:hypothetical protein [Eubacterium sp.]MCM1417236.1 hypothetical protein [Roseburia sp.]MCM1461144.1 hypothetical protein [Bacteroides sp.]
MKYKLTLWLRFMRGCLKTGWKAYLFGLVVVLLLYFSEGLHGREISALTVVLIAVGVAGFFALIFSLTGIIHVSRVHSYQRIYEEKGWCREMCEAFEEKHIRGKKPNNFTRIYYAEIHLRMGDPERARFLLDQLRIPETDAINRVLYLVLYIQTALFQGDVPLARNIWDSNRFFLDKFIYDNRYKIQIAFLRICQVTIEAADGNYAEALDLIGRYMPAKKNAFGAMDFLALQVYVYHQTGSAENEERAIRYMEKAIEETKFEAERQRINARVMLSDARSGKLPL